MLTAASVRRMAVLVPLLAVLAAPQASAAGLRPGFLDLLDRVLSVVRPNLKEGCKLDPNGRCAASAAPLQTKEGCKIDPDGRCHTSATQPRTDTGCKLDPDGLCLQ